MTIEALPYISFVGFLFGTTLVVSRFSVAQFDPTVYVGLRLTLAGMGHVAAYTLARKKFRWPTDPRLWFHAAILGVLGTAVPMTSIVNSLQYLSSGIASVLITTNPAVTVLMSHFLLPDEKLNKRKSAGIMLALAGAALLALSGESGLPNVNQADPRGYLLMATAILVSSAMIIYVRKYMQNYNSFDVASVRMFTAAMVVMPLSALFIGVDFGAVTGQGYAALFYASLIGTFSGMLLAFRNVQRFGATAGAMTGYIIPIFAVFGGWLLLGEKITPVMLGGMALIIAGIAILNERKLGMIETPPDISGD
ncbi:MAG: DMT family transporter [Ardenticatenaceae bacterium]|nr:DMT family transporter [Anaerolineales bacterium]MCB8923627.1 DMT family transporter [Ardenticatenaceae bacterium]MCB8991846.1 DMT family transporter [Ardenticatenaceae bacterium]MCB9005133.1 DMT family transporter [Ardenticatenaceae bacterium]